MGWFSRGMPACFLVLCVSFISFFSSHTVQAQEEQYPYSFGGACASLGQWTQLSLEAANRIGSVVNNLKNDSRCVGLGAKLRAMNNQLLAQMSEEAGGQKKVGMDRLMSLPGEIASLRTFLSANPESKQAATELLMNTIANGTATAAASGSQTSSIISLAQRAKAATHTGLDLLEAVTSQLPNLDQCLMNSDADLAQVLSASVTMAASFVSSGQGISPRISNMISSFSSRLRERRYAQVLRKIHEQNFLTSITCLMEVTSEGYCSARDYRHLLDEFSGRQLIHYNNSSTMPFKSEIVKDGVKIGNPFEGFYVLTHFVPVITELIQEIQIGAEPRLETDAQFQNSILDAINVHQKRVRNALGIYNYKVQTLKTRTDISAKKNDLFDIVKTLSAYLSSSGPVDGGLTNFFTTAKAERIIPFFLIGMDEVPQEVTGLYTDSDGKLKTGVPISWEDYMYRGGKFISKFDDPSALVEQIGVRLRELIKIANAQSITFYNKWFIVDKPLIASRGVTSFQMTYRDVLQGLVYYLDHLLIRLRNPRYHADAVQIPIVLDTRARIEKVLNKYRDFEKYRNLTLPVSESTLAQIDEAYESLNNVVFEQFNVLLSRSGFLANRFAEFVKYDYAIQLKAGDSFKELERDLLYSTGDSVLQMTTQIFSGNPVHALTDLSQAMDNYKESINSLEMVFKDYLIQAMARMNLIVKKGSITTWDLTNDALGRSIQDMTAFRSINPWIGVDLRSQAMVDDPLKSHIAFVFPQFGILNYAYRLFKYKDRYPMTQPSVRTPQKDDDEFGSIKNVLLPKLCIQTLAFDDWMAFLPFCKGVKLETFVEELKKKRKDIDWAALIPAVLRKPEEAIKLGISVDYDLKAVTDMPNKPMNHSKRICAFRDYGRKNYVFYKTLLIQNRKDHVETFNKPNP